MVFWKFLERDGESGIQKSECVVNEGSSGVYVVLNCCPTMWWGPLFIGRKYALFGIEKTIFLSTVSFLPFEVTFSTRNLR